MLRPTLYTRRWSPWSEFDRLQREINDLFRTSTVRGRTADFPAVNIWTHEDSAILTAELPGMEAEDLEVTAKEDTVTIRGSRDVEDAGDDAAYLRRERPSGRFSRSFQLPFRADADGIQADYRNGVLRLTVPRAETDKPRRITVSSE